MIEFQPETSEGGSYYAQVMEAAVNEYITQVEGYGEYRARYLVCLLKELQEGRVSYTVTFFNETQNRAVQFPSGSRRFVAKDFTEARRVYIDCLYPKREAVT